jgi:hypothetical protein
MAGPPHPGVSVEGGAVEERYDLRREDSFLHRRTAPKRICRRGLEGGTLPKRYLIPGTQYYYQDHDFDD